MCGRATLTVSPDELRDVFDLEEVPEMPPRFNIAPSQPLPVIRTPGKLELLPWGTKERRIINVRLERATTKPGGRCLVVLDGFYEWRDADKQPFYFHRVDGKPFAVGGVVMGQGAAIVTSDPLAEIIALHDRMPLVLAEKDWSHWLEGERPAATLEGFESYAVSAFVNSTKNDDSRCIARAASLPPPA
ncbi:MAG TPA: SOS response-associated peptidase [Labilithrix sp.]|nr:SOS response-associated peptidase [Labilithrix sp.]